MQFHLSIIAAVLAKKVVCQSVTVTINNYPGSGMTATLINAKWLNGSVLHAVSTSKENSQPRSPLCYLLSMLFFWALPTLAAFFTLVSCTYRALFCVGALTKIFIRFLARIRQSKGTHNQNSEVHCQPFISHSMRSFPLLRRVHF